MNVLTWSCIKFTFPLLKKQTIKFSAEKLFQADHTTHFLITTTPAIVCPFIISLKMTLVNSNSEPNVALDRG